MNTSADAADQVVRMSLNGAEVALKVTGAGAKQAVVLITKALKSAVNESHRTRGSIRLINLVRSGKKLDVTEVADQDLKTFCTEAKKYGILYTVLKDRDATDGKTEIMYKSEDKEKLGRIFKKLDMATVDMAEVKDEISPDLAGQKPPERTAPEKSDPDKFLEELMKKPNPTKEDGQTKNPTQARTAKNDLSEPTSKSKGRTSKERSSDESRTVGRKSVRKELAEIKDEMSRRDVASKAKSKSKQNKVIQHKKPEKKKKSKER